MVCYYTIPPFQFVGPGQAIRPNTNLNKTFTSSSLSIFISLMDAMRVDGLQAGSFQSTIFFITCFHTLVWQGYWARCLSIAIQKGHLPRNYYISIVYLKIGFQSFENKQINIFQCLSWSLKGTQPSSRTRSLAYYIPKKDVLSIQLSKSSIETCFSLGESLPTFDHIGRLVTEPKVPHVLLLYLSPIMTYNLPSIEWTIETPKLCSIVAVVSNRFVSSLNGEFVL